jgi:hypothetical protein
MQYITLLKQTTLSPQGRSQEEKSAETAYHIRRSTYINLPSQEESHETREHTGDHHLKSGNTTKNTAKDIYIYIHIPF